MDQQLYAEAFQTPTLSTRLHTCRIWCVPDVYPEALAPTSTLHRDNTTLNNTLMNYLRKQAMYRHKLTKKQFSRQNAAVFFITSNKAVVMRLGRFNVCASVILSVCRITAKWNSDFTETWAYQSEELIHFLYWSVPRYAFRNTFPLPSPLQNWKDFSRSQCILLYM